MQKLDAKFEGEIWKAKDGLVVPHDEYVVFLAKDNAFYPALRVYREVCAAYGADEEQIAAVDRLIDRVKAWREAHPDRCKIPDAAGERLLDRE